MLTWDEILALDDAALNRALDAALGVVSPPPEQYWIAGTDPDTLSALAVGGYTQYTASWDRTMELALQQMIDHSVLLNEPRKWVLCAAAFPFKRIILPLPAAAHVYRTAICRCALYSLQQGEGNQ